jgi:hypothetical protein
VAGNFKRITERRLVVPKGAYPFFWERLQCGHHFRRAASRVAVDLVYQTKALPKAYTSARERLCRCCADGAADTAAAIPAFSQIIWKESYNLLVDLAQAVWDAEQEDLKVEGPAGQGE